MWELLEAMGFLQIGTVIDQRMVYRANASEAAGTTQAVYVFLNPDGRVWKIGMTKHGFSRVDYTRVLDGRSMRRPHERNKLERIHEELMDGATQWVREFSDAALLEDLLSVLFEPTESRRRQSKTRAADPCLRAPTHVSRALHNTSMAGRSGLRDFVQGFLSNRHLHGMNKSL